MDSDWHGAGVGAYFCKACGSLYILIARNRKHSLASLACPTLDEENNICETTLHAMATPAVLSACATAGALAKIFEEKKRGQLTPAALEKVDRLGTKLRKDLLKQD